MSMTRPQQPASTVRTLARSPAANIARLTQGRLSLVVLSRVVVASSGTLIVLITSRLLGPDGRGTFATMQAAALLIGTAVSLSMWLGVSTRIAKSRDTATQAMPFALLASVCSVPLLVGLAFASLPSNSASLAAR